MEKGQECSVLPIVLRRIRALHCVLRKDNEWNHVFAHIEVYCLFAWRTTELQLVRRKLSNLQSMSRLAPQDDVWSAALT